MQYSFIIIFVLIIVTFGVFSLQNFAALLIYDVLVDVLTRDFHVVAKVEVEMFEGVFVLVEEHFGAAVESLILSPFLPISNGFHLNTFFIYFLKFLKFLIVEKGDRGGTVLLCARMIRHSLIR